jgi:hypothetical protein
MRLVVLARSLAVVGGVGVLACAAAGPPVAGGRDSASASAVESGPQPPPAVAPMDASLAATPGTPGSDASAGAPDSSAAVAADGPSRCPRTGVTLCEDFESGVLDPGTWKVQKIGSARHEIVSDRAASGTRSWHIRTLREAGHGAWLTETRTFPAPDNTIFGRVYMLIAEAPHNIAQVIISHHGRLPASASYVFGAQLDRFYLTYAPNNPFKEYWKRSATAFPIGRWTCLEWNVVGTSPSATHFWVDGVELLQAVAGFPGDARRFFLDARDAFPAPVFEDLSIGWRVAHTDADSSPAPPPMVDVWIDDIAIGSTRVGCDR